MKTLFTFICLFITVVSWSQGGTDDQLAQYYFTNGEYDKALPYCEKVYNKDKSKFNFKRYYNCLIQIGKEKDAERYLKKQINIDESDLEYRMMLGSLYEQQQKIKEADKLYEELIKKYANSGPMVVELYRSFRLAGKNAQVKSCLEYGRKQLKQNYPLNIEFAEMYFSEGNVQEMIREYLDMLAIDYSYMEPVQFALSAQMDFAKEELPETEMLREKLLQRVQKHPNESIYAEMLIWYFIQKKQFQLALLQTQALDKREKGMGNRVMILGSMCLQNKNYDVARAAYRYVVQLGEDTPNYYEAESALLHTQYIEITEQRNYSQSEIKQTVEDYQRMLDRSGISRRTLYVVMELARIQAYYANDTQAAVESLQKALALQGLTNIQSAEIKMLLADIYVLRDEIWESSLLYMQIDKEFKYEPIGFEAKFKNARIFYYDGDFKFAQSQLDILKQSTSKLIANDAMKLSILITDNYGLDSNFVAMSRFAKADLLLEQHQYAKAFEEYDSIVKEFPEHGLSDEILLRKAQAMQETGKWNEAINYLEELLKYHAYDILADDALFQLGQIQENHLLNGEKASEYYKRILIDHKGSLYTSEARKRIRAIRGDAVEDDSL